MFILLQMIFLNDLERQFWQIVMGRYKTLATNTLIFGICNFTSKLLIFIMLPFYTKVLTKEEFGTADLITNIVGLLLPVLTLSVAHGCMRFALEKSNNLKQIFTFGVWILLIGPALLLIFYPLLMKLPIISDFYLIFIALYVFHSIENFLGLFSRGMQKIKLVGTAGIISSFTAVVLNIVFLFVFHFGIYGYLLSIIVASMMFSTTVFIGGKMYNLFTYEFNRNLSKEIVTYSLPIIPNTLSWWINHSVNRYVISFYCGVAEVGLYAAASKIPTVINTFRGIFVQAWQLSTITEYESEESKSFFNKIYRLFNVFLILSCTFLLVFSKLLGSFLYSDAFFQAWRYSPILISGILFSSLIALYSPIYLAKKKTNRLFLSTFLGAVITIVLNLFLVPQIGPQGAAISTLLSNISIFLFIHVDTNKYGLFTTSKHVFFISYLIVIVQGFIISFTSNSPTGFFSLLCTAIIVILNMQDLLDLLYVARKKIIQRNQKMH